MDTNKPHPDAARPRQSSRPSEAQKAARAADADARKKELSRKARTRGLIEMGGVAAAFGFDSPEQMEAILDALVRSKNGAARMRQLGVRETERWP